MSLSTKTKTYLYWLLAFVSTASILFSIHALLGGFEELTVVESSNNTYSIAGKEFKGGMKSDTLQRYFEEVRAELAEGKLKGELCIVNFRDKDLSGTTVHQLVGVLLGDDVAEIPAGMKVVELESTKTLKVALVMHPLVRPNPDKIEGLMYAYAQEKGYTLQNISMEILYPDNSVLIEMFAEY